MNRNKKINLEFISEEFSFDEEKKTTKCTLTFCPHIKEFAEIYGRPSDEILKISPKKYSRLLEVLNKDAFVVSGVAKCSKDDKYDYDFGKTLAQERARYRAERKYNYWLNLYGDFISDYQNKIYKAWLWSTKAIRRHINFEKSINN